MSSNPHRSALLDTWTETSSHVFNSVLEANRAAFAAFGVNSDEDTDEDPTLPPRERIEPDEDLPEWTIDRTEDDRTELGVGDRIEFTKTISEDDVTSFAAASGDTNPLHLDDEYASETRFRGRIAHGTLVGGLISAALARVPGLVVYLSQDLEFHNPVRIGDRLTAEIEIVEDLGNDQFRLTTQVKQGEEVVIDGEAVILVDEQPE
ncbi:MaoC family dehydratase [Halorientalis pallida]|uniref:MaoC family dehydratase n=1 Tax=Halorientalis pallida TaxID=2479928 RepID=A0A498KYH2_9EURY|nr:MaoC family dehydratase [Halorientalis pallida]RXK50318.1 MaoC family dehydratase [Halorientalis pallida]